jgi:hypothetical protein
VEAAELHRLRALNLTLIDQCDRLHAQVMKLKQPATKPLSGDRLHEVFAPLVRRLQTAVLDMNGRFF